MFLGRVHVYNCIDTAAQQSQLFRVLNLSVYIVIKISYVQTAQNRSPTCTPIKGQHRVNADTHTANKKDTIRQKQQHIKGKFNAWTKKCVCFLMKFI